MISFFVAGTPVPKGSAKAFIHHKTGKLQVMQTNREKQRPWASSVSFHAQEEMARHGHSLIEVEPVVLSLQFVMPRPKAHYRNLKKAGLLLKPNAPSWHTSTPDLDKLVRCVKDALTGIIWRDDRQVCFMKHVTKMYGRHPGVLVCVEPI